MMGRKDRDQASSRSDSHCPSRRAWMSDRAACRKADEDAHRPRRIGLRPMQSVTRTAAPQRPRPGDLKASVGEVSLQPLFFRRLVCRERSIVRG